MLRSRDFSGDCRCWLQNKLCPCNWLASCRVPDIALWGSIAGPAWMGEESGCRDPTTLKATNLITAPRPEAPSPRPLCFQCHNQHLHFHCKAIWSDLSLLTGIYLQLLMVPPSRPERSLPRPFPAPLARPPHHMSNEATRWVVLAPLKP